MQPFLGQIFYWPVSWAPRGFALCQGQLMSIAQNQALFSLLGVQYGGDGRTTFALPDLRGRIMIHQDTNNNIQIGQMSGTENVTLLTTQIPQHIHTVTNAPAAFTFPATNLPALTVTSSLPATTAAGSGKTPGASAVPATAPDWSVSSVDDFIYGTPDGSTSMPVNVNIPGGQALTMTQQPALGTATGTSGSTGGTQPHENMQPYLVMSYIIALSGIFPSRS